MPQVGCGTTGSVYQTAEPAAGSHSWRASAGPATAFVLLSILFGPIIIAFTPPMRGPDEPAHFIRAYGISQGEIIPSLSDAKDRKGLFIPADLRDQMALFERARERVNERDFRYGTVFAQDARLRRAANADDGEAKVFKHYNGSEGYSPVPYLPYLPALALSRALGMDFLGTVYLMRATGFVLLTALMAFAIALTPQLRWTLVLIAMLPSALFARATISGDGGSLALTMMVVALSLRGALCREAGSAFVRMLWMTLCSLAKPAQIAFALLELMRRHRGRASRRLAVAALVMVPALALPVAWAVLGEADVAVWRMLDGTEAAEHFDPIWKVGYMAAHPLHFPALLAASLQNVYYLWQQLIGVLGWLDAPLLPWVYPLLSLCLVALFAVPLGADPGTRRRIGIVAGASAVGYCLAVFLIFYLVWTGIGDDQIHGVQGRYFVVVLPLLAIVVSALINRGLPERMRAVTALFGALVSGCAVIEAILRTDWKVIPLPI